MIFYDTIVKVKRMKSSGGNTRSFVATATGDASIQPIAKEPSAIDDGRFGTLYVCYCEADLPAQRGDQITDPNGAVYVVKEVILRDQVALPHKELTLTKQ